MLNKEEYWALVEAALEHSPDGVLVVDQEWRMLYFNSRFVDMWEIPPDIREIRDDKQSIQTVLEKLEDPEGFLRKVEYLQANPDLCSKDELRLKDGHVYERYTTPLHSADGRFLGRIWFFHDITDRVRAHERQLELEGQVKRLEKLNSLKDFAASIAHHLNNLLLGIIGNIELAEKATSFSKGKMITLYLEVAKEISQRAADLSSQILHYIGDGSIELSDVEIGSLVYQVAQEMKEMAPEWALIEVRPGPPCRVKADPKLLRGCLQSIVHNSLEALEGEGEVNLSWRLERPRKIGQEELPFGEPSLEASSAKHGYVCIEVQDDGCGIEPEILDRVFDPFFSTKEFGRGLGLATVLGIVHSHGGELKLTSEKGRGTKVSVYLPLGY